MDKLRNIPPRAAPVASTGGELRLMAYHRPGLGVALHAYLPHGSKLPLVEVDKRHISHALVKMARRPELQPWRKRLLAAAERLLSG